MLLSLPASTSMTEKEKEFLLMVSSDDEEEDEILSFSVVPSNYISKLNNGKKRLSNRLLVKTTILQFLFFIELIVVIAFDPFDLGTLSKYEL